MPTLTETLLDTDFGVDTGVLAVIKQAGIDPGDIGSIIENVLADTFLGHLPHICQGPPTDEQMTAIATFAGQMLTKVLSGEVPRD